MSGGAVSPGRAGFQLDQLITRVNGSGFSTIRDSLLQVMEIINDPRSDAGELTDFIVRDPTLSANVLRRINSAFYAIPTHISDIKQAVVALGFDEVRALVLQQRAKEMFMSGSSGGPMSRTELWKHSVAVALFCRMLYRRELGEPGNDAYTAGILHDIGLIVIDQFMRPPFQEIMALRTRMRNNIIHAEDKVLGFNHAQIGEKLARSWNIVEELCCAIGSHHKPIGEKSRNDRLTYVLYLADHLCQTARMGFLDTPMLSQQHLLRILRKLDIQRMAAEMILDDVVEEIKRMELEGWFAKEA